MDYAEVFRASPARVVALLRCQDLHQPLSAQLGSHHGFHVLCVPDSDAEYPPPVAERKPQSHYEAYAARGILKRSWVDKHTSRIPVCRPAPSPEPAARHPSSSRPAPPQIAMALPRR